MKKISSSIMSRWKKDRLGRWISKYGLGKISKDGGAHWSWTYCQNSIRTSTLREAMIKAEHWFMEHKPRKYDAFVKKYQSDLERK